MDLVVNALIVPRSDEFKTHIFRNNDSGLMQSGT
jgi:hypothetical protein